eukprot:scaffold43851_cov36-Phaeocystis_antarctica.AAC.1
MAEASGRLFSTQPGRGRRVDAVHLDAVDNVVDLGEVLRGKQAGGWAHAGDLLHLRRTSGVLLTSRQKSLSVCFLPYQGRWRRVETGSAAARGSLGLGAAGRAPWYNAVDHPVESLVLLYSGRGCTVVRLKRPVVVRDTVALGLDGEEVLSRHGGDLQDCLSRHQPLLRWNLRPVGERCERGSRSVR